MTKFLLLTQLYFTYIIRNKKPDSNLDQNHSSDELTDKHYIPCLFIII